jgi:CAS/CSE protein, C-terminus
MFLRHEHWERRGNIPALSMLLQAYLRTAAPALAERNLVAPVLGIFQKLLSVPRHYAEAYALLGAALAYLPRDTLHPFLPQARTVCQCCQLHVFMCCALTAMHLCWLAARMCWTTLQDTMACCHLSVCAQVYKLLFGVLTGPRKSTKNTVAFLVTLCKAIAWSGAAAVAADMDGAQAGSSIAVLSQVLPNNLTHIAGKEARRAVGIGAARALAEHTTLIEVQPTFAACLKSTHVHGHPPTCATVPLVQGPDCRLTHLRCVQNTAAWANLLRAVIEWHCAGKLAAGELIDNTALMESLADSMEFSGEFAQLANAHVPPPPVAAQVRVAV